MKQLFLLAGLIFSISYAGLAQKSSIFKTEDGAIRGYDAVAYFKEGKPVKGNHQFAYSWNGAEWYFANAENKKEFAAHPEKYAPQFGGYCAYGMAKGHKAATDPQAWTIVDGKLYLNYNPDVKVLWNKDIAGFIKTANENWPKLKDKE